MYFLTVYECSKKVSSVEVTIFDFVNSTDEEIDETILASIEYGKAQDGLKGKKHTIKSVMFSIDKETWFTSHRLQF